MNYVSPLVSFHLEPNTTPRFQRLNRINYDKELTVSPDHNPLLTNTMPFVVADPYGAPNQLTPPPIHAVYKSSTSYV